MKSTSKRGRLSPVAFEVESPKKRSGGQYDPNPKKLGNIWVLYQFKNKRILVLGPDWLYSTIMMTILSFIAIGFVVFTLPRLNKWYHWIMGLNVVSTCMMSFIATVIKDPGIVRSTFRDFQALREHMPFNSRDALSTSSDESSDEDSPVGSSDTDKQTDSDKDFTSPVQSLPRDESDPVESRVDRPKQHFETVGIHSMARTESDDDLPSTDHSELATTFGNPTRTQRSPSDDGTPPTLGDRYLRDLESQGGDLAQRQTEASIPRRHATDLTRVDYGRGSHPGAPTRAQVLAAARRRRLRRRSQPLFCEVCKLTPPAGSYHCEDCEVCIEGYDHHCPWTSKCIGKGNVCEFYTWLFSGLLCIVYMGVMTGISIHHHRRPRP
eukprot:Selendium_serpulae@DN2487_c0_g1_i2.p1